MLAICRIPFKSGDGTGRDNGVVVEFRNGWTLAESQMKSVEQEFKRSEKQMPKIVLGIVRDMIGTKLTLKDIEIKISRRNYDNIFTKSQVLISLLSNSRIHPQLAFAHSGMFLDSEGAYLQSRAWWEENEKELEETENDQAYNPKQQYPGIFEAGD